MFSNKTFKTAWLSVVAGLAIVGLPGNAHALEMEFYTYGGFSEVVSAFNKCALIFNANGYKILLPSVFCMSLLVSLGSAALYRLQTVVKDEGISVSGPNSIYSSIISALIGSALFLGLVVPKGTLHIYDPTENLYQAVGGIPIVAVISAGASNLAERAIVDLVSTSGDPMAYSKQAGLKGVQMLTALWARGDESPASDTDVGPSLVRYIDDCVFFEMSRPGTALGRDELKNKTTSISTSLAKANSAADTTVVFSAASPEGAVMTCQDAWTNISTRVNAIGSGGGDTFKDVKMRACSDAGYAVYDSDITKAGLAYNQCVTSANALIKTIDNGWSLDKFVMEMFYANRFWMAIAKSNPEGFANQKVSIRNMSAIQEYLSTMAQKRGMITALAAAMLPFLCLALPTRYWAKVMGMLVSAFMICPVWGMLDAITTDFYLSRAVSTWTSFLGNNWGVDQIALWNSSAIRELSNWGLYVAASFSIALTVARMFGGGFSSIVGGFGGVAASSSEGALHIGRTGAGAMASEATATGSRAAEAAAGGAKSYAFGQEFANVGGQDFVRAQMALAGGGIQADQAMLSSLGTDGFRDLNAAGRVGGAVSAGGKGMAVIEHGVSGSIAAESYNASAALSQTANRMETTGGDANQEAAWAHANDQALRETFGTPDNMQSFLKDMHGKSKGQMEGEVNAYKEANAHGFSGSWEQFQSMRSEVATLGDYADKKAISDIAGRYKMDTLGIQEMMANQKTSKDVARTTQELNANAAAFSRMHPNIKQGDPLYYNQDGSLNADAMDLMNTARGGVGHTFGTKDGELAVGVNSSGDISRMTATGTRAADKPGGRATDYKVTYDANGNVASSEQKQNTSFDGSHVVNKDNIYSAKTVHDTSSTTTSLVSNISGSYTQTGNRVDTINEVTGEHQAGFVNKQGHFIQGTKDSIVTSRGVENTGDGLAVTTRTGDRHQGSVDVMAVGRQQVDTSASSTFGDAGAKNVGSLNTGLASQGWKDRTSLDVGMGSKTLAIGEQSVAVTAQKVGQGKGMSRAPLEAREMSGPTGYGKGGGKLGDGGKASKMLNKKVGDFIFRKGERQPDLPF